MDFKTVFKSYTGMKAVLKVYDELLKQWPVTFEELYVKTTYGSTFIIASGEEASPPLILLHGTSSNSSMWIGDVASYSKHYRVFAIDIPGEPGKSGNVQYPMDSCVYSEWLSEVLNGLALDKAIILGLSIGGWTALSFATRNPDRVEKLVLISTSGIGPQKVSFIFKSLPLLLMGEKGYARMAHMVCGNDEVPDKAIGYSMLMSRNFNMRTTVPLFSDLELKCLSMPILLYAGEKDVLLHSSKTIERIRRLLPHANVNLIPGIGHLLLNLDKSILEFLCVKGVSRGQVP